MRVLTEGVHSGDASGIVPSTFRILRSLLSRIEDESTGAIKLPELFVQVPQQRIEQAKEAARHRWATRSTTSSRSRAGIRPMSDDPAELILNRTWRPQLAVIGMDGFPAPENAGNVLRPTRPPSCSVRLPPTLRRRDMPCRRSRTRSRPTRPTARRSSSTPKADRPAGTRRRWRPGWRSL